MGATGAQPTGPGFDITFIATPERARDTLAEIGTQALETGFALPEAKARAWDLYVSSARTGSAEPEIFSEPGLFVMDKDGVVFFARTQSAPFTRPDLVALLRGLVARSELCGGT